MLLKNTEVIQILKVDSWRNVVLLQIRQFLPRNCSMLISHGVHLIQNFSNTNGNLHLPVNLGKRNIRLVIGEEGNLT